MFETLDKIRLAGIGAFSMTRQRAEEVFDELVKRGEVERMNKKGFVEDLMDAAAKTRTEVEQVIEKQLQEAMARLNLPTKSDLGRIEAKLDELLKKP
jgi:poly(hydroxyalkanoate) granule-associated protein